MDNKILTREKSKILSITYQKIYKNVLEIKLSVWTY